MRHRSMEFDVFPDFGFGLCAKTSLAFFHSGVIAAGVRIGSHIVLLAWMILTPALKLLMGRQSVVKSDPGKPILNIHMCGRRRDAWIIKSGG